ncbi:MAG: right-handed parallel beta-helix repeat-containing protein [Thermoanaerobaculales bacterium]|jgi:hypothetical protein|nr:right-handed parallel beta-helix repeat-containing protein [Thermoanaerobaculales bacterium]
MRLQSCVQAVIAAALVLLLSPLAVSAQGAIEGTVTFWGDPGGGTQIEIAAHSDPYSTPDVTVVVSIPGGPFSMPVPDGTYYVAVLMARDGVFGEPRPEDVLAWYDADADGDWDTVTVSGSAVTGVDVNLGFVYVDVDATGANNGSSWTDALTDLQDGIDLAVSGIDVWVAEGTYVPGANRSASFLPKPGVRVSGGFTGTETVRLERDWNANPTILSGEIGAAGNSDNCYHVVNAGGANPTAVLDGFTVTLGNANGGGDYHSGGGITAFNGGLSIANSIISNNSAGLYGGGIAINATGTVFVANSSLVNNVSAWHGGGMHIAANAGVPSTVLNCVFTGNTAWRGGGIAVEGQIFAPGLEPGLINLSLSNNSAGGEGGGIHTNTTTFNPPAGAPVTIVNSILWDNGPLGLTSFGGSDVAVVNYSIVEGGWAGPGTSVLNISPSFSDADLRLNLDSPAIDAGDGSHIPRDTHDLDGDNYVDGPVSVDRDFNRRWVDIPSIPDTGPVDPGDDAMDMGAYEAFDSTLIFHDGFEGGGTGNWSSVVGLP